MELRSVYGLFLSYPGVWGYSTEQYRCSAISLRCCSERKTKREENLRFNLYTTKIFLIELSARMPLWGNCSVSNTYLPYKHEKSIIEFR